MAKKTAGPPHYSMFRVMIRCDNAAFEDEPAKEINRILSGLQVKVEALVGPDSGPVGGNLLDLNGATVGSWTLRTEL